MSQEAYRQGLDQNPANYVPLSPLTYLERAAYVYPTRLSVVYNDRQFTWAQTYERCRRLASALVKAGVKPGDTVATMLPNVPAMYEAHFGIPMSGAVLNTLNTRIDSESVAFMLRHGEAKVLLTDPEYADIVGNALEMMAPEERPRVVDVADATYAGPDYRLGQQEYEDFIAGGDADFVWNLPGNEWDAIALNYTSGTTGNPKGVVYHHRGAFLNALGNQTTWAMGHHPVYLWTLPMFHCNGWCYPWTVTALAGTHVCLRRVDPQKILTLIREHRVSHLCGAPIVLNALVNMPDSAKAAIDHPVHAMVAGAAPPAKVIGAVEAMGIQVAHVYGLTEVYGPVTVCAWHGEWDALSLDERARIKARQGVRYPTLEGLMVADPQTLEAVPRDGETLGEIFMRGNTVMKGYLKNPSATEEAFAGGWFHTGDLGVCHPDGYIEIKDRLKDIIISGGENISTIEVEGVLYRHPAVLEASVVARPDDKWGETPCAFVTLKPDHRAVADSEIIAFCREHLAHFKVPKTVVFRELPKTSTGKIQKYVLRDWARAL